MTHLIPLFGVSLFAVLALAPTSLLGKESKAESPPCPHFLVKDGPDLDSELDHVPTTPFHSECRLNRDVLGLAKTLSLPPGTTLDCQGHKIVAATPGALGDANSRSTPELAIFRSGAGEGGIKNCILEDFDHGIFIAKGKSEGSDHRSAIQGNSIGARFVAIHVAEADNIDINNNILRWFTRGGVGVLVHYDSDHVEVTDNQVFGDFLASTQGARLMPGPTDANSNRVFTSGHGGILVLQILATDPLISNAVINGNELFQFVPTDNTTPNEEFTEDILVADNAIIFPKGRLTAASDLTEDGIVVSNTIGTVVSGNTIGEEENGANVRQAIRAGSAYGPTGGKLRFPNKCVQKTDRACLSNSDCNVPGIDAAGTDTCSLTCLPTDPPLCTPYTEKIVSWLPEELTYENNTIYGRFQSALGTTADLTTIRGNRIHGKLPSGAATSGFGITVGGNRPLENAVITRNRISNVTTPLRFVTILGMPDFFGAAISLNDFIEYTTAVAFSGDYPFVSELSVDGAGNYWCHSSPTGECIPEFYKNFPQPVMDSHPFDAPVACLPSEPVPEFCEADGV